MAQPRGVKVLVLSVPLAIVLSVLIVSVIASWTVLVFAGRIPPTLPQWQVPAAGIGGFVTGVVIPLFAYLRAQGISFGIATNGSDPPPSPLPGLPPQKRDARRDPE